MTIKAGFLRNIITHSYGVNAVLHCRFSAGADWKINVIYYDAPVFRDMEDNIGNFLIPVAYNGAQIKAMEAIYKSNGRNAPPNDWTSYKEYNLVFKPSTYRVELSTDFLNGLEDGEILLKFHLWSGEMIEYVLVKEGNNIKGISSQRDNVSPGDDAPTSDGNDNEVQQDKIDQDYESNQMVDPAEGQTKMNVSVSIVMAFVLVISIVLSVYLLAKKGLRSN